MRKGDGGHTEGELSHGKGGPNPLLLALRPSARPQKLLFRNAEMIENNVQVAAIGFEVDVKDIAKQRNASTDGIDAQISQHAQESLGWHTKLAGLVDEKQAHQRGTGIAHAGQEPEDRIRAQSYTRSRYPDRRIHQPGNAMHPAQPPYPILMVDAGSAQFAPAFGAGSSAMCRLGFGGGKSGPSSRLKIVTLGGMSLT